MPNSEQITLEIDERPAVQATARANASIEGHEKAVKSVMDGAGKQWEVYGEKVIRVSDKSRGSLDRLTKSMEQQAALYGKTGVERLIAQRDQLIAKWGQEERAVQSITKAYEKMIAAEHGGGESKWAEFGEKVKSAIENPLQAVGDMAKGLLEKLGPVGVGITVVAATLTAVAVAGVEAARGLAEYGIGIRDVGLRTGLTSKEVVQFSFAAKAAGSDVSVFERMMRGLTVAVEDQSSAGEKARGWMLKFGVDLRGVRDGSIPTSEVFRQISEGLEKLPPGFERGAAAMALFKRAGIDAIPTMLELSSNLKIASDQGFGTDEETVKRYAELNVQLSIMDRHFADIKLRLEEKFVMTLSFVGNAANWFLSGGTMKDPWTVQQEDRARERLYSDISDANRSKGKFSTAKTGDPMHDLAVSRELALQGLDPNLANNPPAPGSPAALKLAAAAEAQRQMDAINKAGGTEAIAKQAEESKRGDAAVLAYQQKQGLAGKLKREEEILAKMPKPEVGVSTSAQVAAYSAEEKKVKGFKDQEEAAKKAAEEQKRQVTELAEWRHKAAELNKKDDEAELGTLGRIYYLTDQLIKQAPKGATAADILGVRQRGDAAGAFEFNKEMAAFEVEAQKSMDARRKEDDKILLSPYKGQIKDQLAGFATADRIDSINMDAQKDSLNRNASHAMKVSQLSGDTGMDAIREAYQIRIGLAKELAAVEAERISKETDGNKQLEMMALAQKDIQKEMAEAQEESLMKQLELQKKQMDGLKKDTEHLWNTLLTKPGEFGKQLADTVHAAVIKPIAEGMSNVTAHVLKPVIYGADGGGGISGAFKGLFGGGKQDPMKTATDMNTAVTSQNSAALSVLTAILAGAMGMSAPAIAAPAGFGGISLPSISVSAPSAAASPISAMLRGGGGSAGGGFVPMLFSGAPSNGGGGGFAPSQSFGQSFGGGGETSTGGLSGGSPDLFSLPTADRNGSSLTSMLFGGGGAAGGSGGSSSNPMMALLGTGGSGNMFASLGNPSQGTAMGGTGGKSGAGSLAGNFTGLLKNFKGNLGGFTRGPGTTTEVDDGAGNTASETSPGKITGVSGLAGAALMGGGMMAAQHGLLGADRGTGKGIAEGALGGAAIGLAMGGPLGAAIGAGVGLGIGVGEMLAGVETPENKAKRLCKQIYGISIDSGMAKQIAALAQSKYGGNVTIAVRDPETRKMLQLYATGTGQKFPLSASTPEAGSLAEQGGKLYQQATFSQNGNPYTFQSSLPVAGGFNSGQYPSPQGSGTGSVTLNVNGQSAADLLEGRIANTVNPGFVQDQFSSASASSNGRLSNSAMIQQPGLLVS